MTKSNKEKLSASVMAFIEKNAKKPTTIKYEIPGMDPIVVNVRSVIPFGSYAATVRAIVGIVFMNNGQNIDDYAPENLEFAKRYVVVSSFTDFKVPTDINDAWLVLYNTPLYDDVMNIVGDYAGVIFDAANDLIEARLRFLSGKTGINDLISKISEKVDGMNMNISQEDIQAMLKTLGNMPSMTPESIVSAVVKAQEDKDNNNK